MRQEAPPLADTHCHLVLPQFESDLAGVLERARVAGIARFLVPGTDLVSSRRGVELAESDADIYAAVGLHPHSAVDWDAEARAELRAMARSGRVVAIGEIGLDYFRDLSPHEAQQRAFREQLELAAELGLPVVVHNRQASGEVLDGLLSWTAGLGSTLAGRAGVLHAFSGDPETASKAMSAGFYIGVAGPVTYPSARRQRDWLAKLPLERLLVETDSPYLPPQPHRGQRNEPAYTRLVAEELARLLGLSYGSVARMTSASASRLFGWDHGIDHGHIL
jgi:TatD DNase family protein